MFGLVHLKQCKRGQAGGMGNWGTRGIGGKEGKRRFAHTKVKITEIYIV